MTAAQPTITEQISKEETCLQYVFSKAKPGNAESILESFDEFNRDQDSMMNLGMGKRKQYEAVLEKYNPVLVLEIGSYCGYSAITAATILKKLLPPEISPSSPSKISLLSVEVSSTHVGYTSQTLAFANLSESVKILHGTLQSEFDTICQHLQISSSSSPNSQTPLLIFLDHDKKLYLKDLKFLESHGIIQPGVIIVADNILYPGVPEYAHYVRNSPKYASTFVKGHIQTSQGETKQDGIEVSVCVQ
eukprot:Sdes_comp19484_c0_seq1m10969